MTHLLALLQSEMSQDQANKLGAAIAGMMGIIFFIGLIVVAFMIFAFWRILSRAGFSGALSLLILLWPIGLIIIVCILAFGDWKVAPVPQYGGYPPSNYPPSSFPPAPPTV